MKRKELFWMLVPCLLFASAALWMRAREARLPADDGRFHLTIEKIETPPIAAKDAADGYDTEVVVTLNHRGPTPAWWDKQNGGFGDASSKARLFYEADGKKIPVKKPPAFKAEPPIFYWRPIWQTDAKNYKARFFLKLAELPARREKTVLRAPLAIESGYPHSNLSPVVPLVFTVRAPKQVIKKPVVSTNPLLRIIKAEVIKQSAAQQKTNGGYDTEVNVHLQDIGPPSDKGAASSGGTFVDEKDNYIPSSGGNSSGSRGDSRRPVLFFDCRISAMPKTQRTIYVKMKYSCADRWPLQIWVPLRLDGKDTSGTVQALTSLPTKKQN